MTMAVLFTNACCGKYNLLELHPTNYSDKKLKFQSQFRDIDQKNLKFRSQFQAIDMQTLKLQSQFRMIDHQSQ
mgnify:FL=1